MKSPGHRQHPGHRVLERRMPGRLQASVGGDVLAESDDVLEVDEDDNPPRYYFPRGDVRAQALQRTASPTHCPYKGDGVLFAVRLGDGTTVADGAWSYEQPYDEHAALKDRVAFWSEKFENIEFKAVP
ncbi:MAG: DUF427 domain-containing protein [Burkholderiaceae bacterium]